MSSPVWLITGASSGFGLVLCLRVLRAGHHVVGSVRSKAKAATVVKQIEQAGGSVVEMDMTESQTSIASKVQAIGRIDYLVNVAGYSILAACEDITRPSPAMRAQRSGTIVNVSSGAAKDPLPACSLYSASKAALEAASESLAKEVAPHNIHVLIVEPGNFRTNFVSAVAPHYDDPVGSVMRKFLDVHGKQIGDPEKAVERIFEAVTGVGMAGHLAGNVARLVLGRDALERMKKSNDMFRRDLSLQEELATSTDFA
ncbi:MAG: hypothetical protein M1818_003264 [Claussenomyces sp. TS43310]|nr:MAG: hypothetical protein M1818_003264 [Claussenomyces sp. TS43310]